MTRDENRHANAPHARSRAPWRTIVLAGILCTLFSAQALAQGAGLFRTDAYLSITRGSKLTWSLRYDRLVDSLRTVSLFVDSAVLADSMAVLRGLIGGTGIPSDSLDGIMTTGNGRLFGYALIAPGADGDILVTAAGAAFWTATPAIADRVGQYFTWTSISHNNAADTGSGKNQPYIGVAGSSKLWPLPHGTTYSAITASFYLRSDTHNRYTATMTTVGSGATALVAGDALVMRLRPASAVTDKQVRLYRIPDGFRADGWGSGTAVYGEHIGTWTIPAALWSGTLSTTNLECELTLKVK